MSAARDLVTEGIAREILGIPTLAPRGRDSLDFYDLGVLSLQAALDAAYEAGRAAPPETIVCPLCKGTGERTSPGFSRKMVTVSCAACKGRGSLAKARD